MKTVGFIGCGTMGEALATAAAKTLDPQEIVLTDVDTAKAEALADRLGCTFVQSNAQAVQATRYLILCVKPQYLGPVLDEIKETVQGCLAEGQQKILVSIVAGIESERYWRDLEVEPAGLPVIRMLPNTACLIGEGFTLIMDDPRNPPETVAELKRILAHSGGFDVLSPQQFTAGCVLTSTSPAFVAMFANSLADAGVFNGLLRPQARQYALQGILSTVRLLQASDKHFEALKDDVCSPLGPAIIGVKSLEDSGFRSSVINAVVDAYRRFAEM